MLSLMRKPGFANDPRIPVLFQPDKDGSYGAMPTEAPDVAAIAGRDHYQQSRGHLLPVFFQPHHLRA